MLTILVNKALMFFFSLIKSVVLALQAPSFIVYLGLDEILENSIE